MSAIGPKRTCASGDDGCSGHCTRARTATHYMLKLSNAGFWRVFARLSGLCLDQPWRKALTVTAVWLVGMFAPLWVKTLVQLPNWVAMTWMISWALLGYIFAPYGMWKHHRTQITSSSQPDRK